MADDIVLLQKIEAIHQVNKEIADAIRADRESDKVRDTANFKINRLAILSDFNKQPDQWCKITLKQTLILQKKAGLSLPCSPLQPLY